MNSLRRTPTCRRRCACARRPRLAHVGHVPRASVFDLPVPSGDRGTGIMSHPQKTCRVLSPSARVGLRPFGAIMPCCALLVAGEPPQQGVNCPLTPNLTPSFRKRSASHISSNPPLRRRLQNWPRSRPRPHDGSNSPWQPLFQQSPQPSPAPPPPPVAVIPAPTWPPPALPLLSQPFPPAARSPRRSRHHFRYPHAPPSHPHRPPPNPAPQRMSPGTMARQRRRP